MVLVVSILLKAILYALFCLCAINAFLFKSSTNVKMCNRGLIATGVLMLFII